MTPEVKKRIEQIRQGIVPEGYKKTKTDIVPADWKESPIGKYIREYTEKTTIPNQYPVLTSARTGLMLQTDYYSNRQVTTEDNVGYNVLPYGYITFRSRSDDGRFRFNENRIIERGIISYFYPVFSFSEEVCHEYMLYLLNFSIYRRMYPYAEGTAQQVLSLKKLGQLKYSLPLVAEQKKIAEILSTQDKAIELQGRKIEELKRFKKGCLEMMFPRKGQKVPEKRFPGFTGDWEQRKLRELAIFNPKAELPDTFEYVDLESVVGTEMLSHRTESKQSAPSRAQRLAQTGDLFYQTVRPYQKNNYLFEKPDKYYVFSTGYAQMRPVVDGRFLLCLVQNDRFVKVVLDNCTGTSYPAINSNDLAEIDVYSPNNPQEQKQIGDFFKDLDNLITLHQRKLEEMKKQKKALMQLLLTGIVRI